MIPPLDGPSSRANAHGCPRALPRRGARWYRQFKFLDARRPVRISTQPQSGGTRGMPRRPTFQSSLVIGSAHRDRQALRVRLSADAAIKALKETGSGHPVNSNRPRSLNPPPPPPPPPPNPPPPPPKPDPQFSNRTYVDRWTSRPSRRSCAPSGRRHPADAGRQTASIWRTRLVEDGIGGNWAYASSAPATRPSGRPEDRQSSRTPCAVRPGSPPAAWTRSLAEALEIKGGCGAVASSEPAFTLRRVGGSLVERRGRLRRPGRDRPGDEPDPPNS